MTPRLSACWIEPKPNSAFPVTQWPRISHTREILNQAGCNLIDGRAVKIFSCEARTVLGKGWTCIPATDLGGLPSDHVSCLPCPSPQGLTEWLTACLWPWAPCRDLLIPPSFLSVLLEKDALCQKRSFDSISVRTTLLDFTSWEANRKAAKLSIL